MSRIFWDTNLFVYLVEDRGARAEQVTALRQWMIERGDELLTSALTLGEVLVKPMEAGNETLMRRYEHAIGAGATVLPFDESAARSFADIRRDRSIRAPDAIQLACAAACERGPVRHQRRPSQPKARSRHPVHNSRWTRRRAVTSPPSLMDLAMAEAEAARDRGEVPVGAVVVDGRTGAVLARAGTRRKRRTTRRRTPRCWPSALRRRSEARPARGLRHLRHAGALRHVRAGYRLCPAAATSTSARPTPRRRGRARRPHLSQPTCHHRPEVIGGVQETRAAELLRRFFEARPVAARTPIPAVAGRVPKLYKGRRHSTGENPWRPSAPFRSSSPMPPAAT